MSCAFLRFADISKRIIICCDGTGNEINDDHSSVLKYYRTLRKSAEQVTYYDPGIGTLGARSEWAKLKQNSEKILGLAFGYGLDQNVLDAYRFLVGHYQPGDQLYFLGFSRGAYSVRVLAGFINAVGLLRPEQLNLCSYAFASYKQISDGAGFKPARLFEQALRPHRPAIRFLGLWDTVSSIIIPRRDRFYIPSSHKLAYTATNPSVEVVRHALAIDERRRMFRPYQWKADQPYWSGPFPNKTPSIQDTQQVWFVGVHSDIGGGYAEADSGLSKQALAWMINETPAEVEFVTQTVNQIVLGQQRAGSSQRYAPPTPTALLHDSINPVWWGLEVLPKLARHRKWPARQTLLGWYLPLAEPRFIEPDADIHASVAQRQQADSSYRPPNVPAITSA